jgi:hypothetical protein
MEHYVYILYIHKLILYILLYSYMNVLKKKEKKSYPLLVYFYSSGNRKKEIDRVI